MAAASIQLLGVPPFVSGYLGIDEMGSECRVAPSVTVMRWPSGGGDDAVAITLGEQVELYEGVRLVIGDDRQQPQTGIRFGNRIIVNAYAYLSGEGGLTIDDEVLVGTHVNILSAGHAIDGGDPSIWRNPLTYGPIHIGRGAWIGAGATLLPGVTVGVGAVIGAGSIVTKSVADFAIVAGNPARQLRFRRGFCQDKAAPLDRRILGRRWWGRWWL